MSFPTKNLYYRRLVAESAAKACWLDFKPTSTVLIDESGADWMYVCPGHLTDPKFATPKDGEDLAKKKKEEEIEKEIEALKTEFAEKMRRKLDRQHAKDGKDGKEKKKDDEEEKKKLEDEHELKVKELQKKKEPEKAKVEGPRIFELHKSFFQMRQQRKIQAAAAKRQQERMRSADFFPSVPKGP
jgi:hypothetical protein